MSETVKLKPWEKPTLTPHQGGALNKFGRRVEPEFMESIDGVAVKDLIAQFGSPLFVLSEDRLRENVRRLRRAFETRYRPVIQGWSYKTNYLNAVCSILHQEGAWAEVVSAFEYEKARALGVPGDRILFNGPNKGKDILQRCVAEGGRVHLDNLDELYLLEEVARSAGKEVKITMRLNFDTGYTDPWSRFGFNIESGQALDAATRIAQSKYLKLTGLHSHIGTFILDLRAYAAQVTTMCQFMQEVEEQRSCLIESLDIGGGFASQNALQGVYLPSEQVVPTIDQYADTICTTLVEQLKGRTGSGKPMPTLIMESGRYVVDDAEVLVSSVVATKRLPNGRPSAVLDAGVNVLFTAFWYNHKVQTTRPLQGVAEDTVLYGPLCMHIDIVRSSIMLPPLTVGDTLVISPVGAYNNTQWMQFIEYRPNIVMIHADKRVSIIRKAEDLSVVTAQECCPEHLRSGFAFG